MGAGMFPLGGGTPNPRPNFRSFSTPGRYRAPPMHRGRYPGLDNVPRTQTVQQLAGWNTANKDWDRIEAARKKRKEAYEAMAQKSGDVPTAYKSKMGDRDAGDPLSPVQAAGGQAPSYEPAMFGQPRKRREQYRSIVNLRNP